MTTTTFESAKICPRCNKPGEDMKQMPGPRGATIHVVYCRTEGCRWEGTSWIIQVNRDGSIPIRKPGEKDFEPYTESQRQHARDVRRFNQALLDSGEMPRG
jgi:hypothetical protein